MRGRSSGFVLIAMLASTVVLLTIVGLAIDTGHLQLVKVRMQTAADAAAAWVRPGRARASRCPSRQAAATRHVRARPHHPRRL